MAADPAEGGFEYPENDLESVADLVAYRAWIMSHFGRYLRGDVIEIGAGDGAFGGDILATAGVRALTMVEPSARLAARLTARYGGDSRVRIVAGSGAQALAATSADVYDAAVMVNVLEHIEHDREFLTDLRARIRPGGHLLLFVPALPWLYGEIDRRVGHWRRYTRRSLHACVAGAGFRIEKVRYFDSPGMLPWLIVARWLGRTQVDRRMARLYDRLVVPAARAIETAIPPPIGKNLVLIAAAP